MSTRFGIVGSSAFVIAAAMVLATGCSSTSSRRGSDSGDSGGSQAGGLGAGGVATGGAPGSGGSPGTGGRAAGGTGAGGLGAGGTAGKGAGGSDASIGVDSGAGGAIDSGAGGQGGGGGKATGGSGGKGVDAGCSGSGCPSDGGSDAATSPCSQLTTATACDARSDCHSVYVDPGTCGCAPSGCCARFNRCADGGRANCTGPATCKMAEPFCESPYVVSYSNDCYEGCVRQTSCAPATCPQEPPTSGTACGSGTYACYYENCSAAGRTEAKCAAGKWTVESAPCSTVSCAGAGIVSTVLTCAVGQICVRTTGGGGAYVITPSCVSNTCGNGPVSPQCLPALEGTCGIMTSLSGATVSCSLPSACGDAACA